MSLLTKQEIHKLREFFKEYDEEGEGEISKSSSREVFRNWYLSLIHRREEDIPVWDWIGTDWVKTDYNNQIVCKEFNTVKWKDFVLNHALYILAARPNTGSMRPYVPKLNSCYSEVEDEEDDNKSY